jgi:hypothetical protein
VGVCARGPDEESVVDRRTHFDEKKNEPSVFWISV